MITFPDLIGNLSLTLSLIIHKSNLELSMRNYYVYILTNKYKTVLYIGLTNDISRRIFQHQNHTKNSFSDRYNVNKLVYLETFRDRYFARLREKQLKKWNRLWKEELIAKSNPKWQDLSAKFPLSK